ncbi:MAG: fumarate hydratase C-terminal domain-containing protein [Spirochaetes bacterium]|nr:fumarate hydratase C-terminal domain-containing protein [Spirochaetota bacterium]
MSVVYLKTPFIEKQIRNLKLGDSLYISGTIFLMRDEAHERALKLFKEKIKLPFDIKNLAVFHCGPIVQKKNNNWKVLSAGPTTSMRMELFEDEMIKNYQIRVVIGKGGMGEKTINAMKKYGAVFASFTGGAGVLLPAKCIKKVKEVHWLDLGTPEAFWVFEVENFGPLTISIDAQGNSLYKKVNKEVDKGRVKAYKYLGINK